jgi:DnaJ-class molecular chaperone
VSQAPAAPRTSSASAVVAPVQSSPSGAAPPLKPTPLPVSGSIEALTPAQATELARLASALDDEDYFQMLQLPQRAVSGDIKRAFYRESRVYHPDRFYHLPSDDAKEHINTIYKRITEAYYVLRDDAKRKKYLADLAGPDRASKLRYSEASDAEQKAETKKAAEEEFGANPKSRQFFKSALADLAAQNWSSAERNLKMGLTYDPANQKFKDRLVEVQKKLDDQRRGSGNSFKIK